MRCTNQGKNMHRQHSGAVPLRGLFVGFMALILAACGGGGGSGSTASSGDGTGGGGGGGGGTISCLTGGGATSGALGNGLGLLAGAVGGAGALDGAACQASFNTPTNVAIDGNGNIFVADANNQTIRKITPAGVVTTFAGTAGKIGSSDGTGAAARFYLPIGLTVDTGGNLYVVDTSNQNIRKITPAGVVTTLAGSVGQLGSIDGTGAAARFSNPQGIAVDSNGNLFVADSSNHTIRKITQSGVVTTVAGSAGQPGNADGIGTAARFNNPVDIAVDGSGNVYVADTYNDTIRKITPADTVTTLAGSAGQVGSLDGAGAAARFNGPQGVSVDASGNIYVGDTGSNTIREITSAGVVTTMAGTAGQSGWADGMGVGATAAKFYSPAGVTVDVSGNVYVADQFNHTIRKITSAGVVTTFAGASAKDGSTDGTGVAAGFFNPNGIAVDASGNSYVADSNNNTIRKVTPAGVVTTFAGLAGHNGSTDGAVAAARFSIPKGVAVDSSGNLYVADYYNYTIRKITAAGVVTTLAGTAGQAGSVDGAGAAARFYNPAGVAVDSSGNVYVADQGNDTIRKITPAGVVTTIGGIAGSFGTTDGGGNKFGGPAGVAVDSSGNVYVADRGDDTIAKITPSGVITTLAGTSGSAISVDGLGAAARFNNPEGIAVDGSGNVYVADTYNNSIRKITPTGLVTTIVGVAGSFGIQVGPLPGSLALPRGVAITTAGHLVITSNNAVLVAAGTF